MNQSHPKAVAFFFALLMRHGRGQYVTLTREQLCEATGFKSKWLVSMMLADLHNAGWLARKVVKRGKYNLLALKFMLPGMIPVLDTKMTRREEYAALRRGLFRDPVVAVLCSKERARDEHDSDPHDCRFRISTMTKWFLKSGLPIPCDVCLGDTAYDPATGAGGPVMYVPRRRSLRWRIGLGQMLSSWELILERRTGGAWVRELAIPAYRADHTADAEDMVETVRPFAEAWRCVPEDDEKGVPGPESGDERGAARATGALGVKRLRNREGLAGEKVARGGPGATSAADFFETDSPFEI